MSYSWSDVGSWQAVWELSKRDADENAAEGKALFVDARRSYVASKKQLVSSLGLDNVVVVTTDDAVLVANRECGDGLRRVVERLQQVAPALTLDHFESAPSLGSYQSLDLGDRYQVKRIVVKQGGRLSLQLHHHRAEHWVVVWHRAGDNRRQCENGTRKTNRFTYRSAPSTAWKIRARSISNSSRCRPSAISARTISSGSRTTTIGNDLTDRCAHDQLKAAL